MKNKVVSRRKTTHLRTNIHVCLFCLLVMCYKYAKIFQSLIISQYTNERVTWTLKVDRRNYSLDSELYNSKQIIHTNSSVTQLCRSPPAGTRLLGSCFGSADRQTDLNQCRAFTCRIAEKPQKLLTSKSRPSTGARYKCFYTSEFATLCCRVNDLQFVCLLYALTSLLLLQLLYLCCCYSLDADCELGSSITNVCIACPFLLDVV